MQVETRAGRSTLEITVEHSPAEVVARLQSYLAIQTRFRIISINEQHADLNVGVSWRAWGAHVHLQFTPLAGTHTMLQAQWTPDLPTQVFDWGLGKKDLTTLTTPLLT